MYKYTHIHTYAYIYKYLCIHVYTYPYILYTYIYILYLHVLIHIIYSQKLYLHDHMQPQQAVASLIIKSHGAVCRAPKKKKCFL